MLEGNERRLMIGQFADSYAPTVDGVVTVVKNYAYWLHQKYGGCVVAAPKTPGYEIHEPFPVIPFISIPAYGREPYRLGLPGVDLKFQRRMREIEFDLVHAHSPFVSGMEAMHIAKERNIPLVTTFHSKYYDDFLVYFGNETIAQAALSTLMRFYEKADYVWTVSDSTVQTLREYGYRGDVEVIQNGTEVRYPLDSSAAREKAAAMCALEEGQPLLLFVGQHILQKNTPLLIRAFARYRALGGRAKLAMVGQGYAREELELLAHEHGVGKEVVFLGQIDDRELLSGFYLRASLFVFPSLYDNAPIVVREAAAMGCPSVMIRESTAAEIISDGVNGFLCANSAEALGKKLFELLADDKAIKSAGEAAKDTIVTPWENIVDSVYERYKEIVMEHADKRGARARERMRVRKMRQRRKHLRKYARVLFDPSGGVWVSAERKRTRGDMDTPK